LAIPINTFLKLASQNGMNLSYLDDNFTFANSFADNKKVLSVAISPDGQAIASGLADGTIELWNRNTSKKLRTLNGHSERLNSVVFSPDGTALVSGSEDGTIKIWNLRTGQLTHSLQGDIGFVRSIAISPTSQTLAASGSADINNIKIWNLRTGELVSTLKGHPNFVNAVAFSADGKTLVSGSSDNTIKIWNLDTCKGTQPCSPTQTVAGHSTTVKSIAVSPYEPILASGSYSFQDISNDSDNPGSSDEDATIKIWNCSTGELLHTLNGHSRTVTSLAIDPFGHLLASGSYDGTIKIWNLHTGQLLHTLEVRNARGDAVYVFSVAFSTDGQTIISGGDDGTVKIWQVTKRVK
jgi:WD40 repeat protein